MYLFLFIKKKNATLHVLLFELYIMIQLATRRNRKLTNDHIRCPYGEIQHVWEDPTPDFYNSKLLAF